MSREASLEIEDALCELPEEVGSEHLTVSEDATTAAWCSGAPLQEGRTRRGKRDSFVMWGHREGPRLDAVGSLALSQTGDSVGYAGFRDGQCHAFIDHVEGPAATLVGNFVFFGDRRSAYQLREVVDKGRGRKIERWVVDGVPGAACQVVGSLATHGRRYAHSARQKGKWRCVCNGEIVGERWGLVQDLAFDRNGADIAYRAQEPGKDSQYDDGWHVIYGSKDYGPFDELGAPVFAPNGALWFWARKGYEVRVYRDGEPRGRTLRAVTSGPAFLDDGTPVFSGYDESQQQWIAVGEEERHFDAMVHHIVPAHGGRLAIQASAQLADGEHPMTASNSFVEVDGARGPRFQVLRRPTFSSDGHRYAYAGGGPGAWTAIVDGEARQPQTLVTDMAFASDGALAYLDVVDGVPADYFGFSVSGGIHRIVVEGCSPRALGHAFALRSVAGSSPEGSSRAAGSSPEGSSRAAGSSPEGSSRAGDGWQLVAREGGSVARYRVTL